MEVRILHVVTYMGRGGLETMIMNYYRCVDRTKVQFDFLVHRDFKADYDDEILSLGGRIYRLPKLVPWSPTYQKALNHFFESHPEYRIVHVHQDCLSSVILKAAKKHNVPVRIGHSHSASQDKNVKYIIKLWYRRSISKYATELFACSKDAGEWMFCGAPFQILNNAIDAMAYSYNQTLRQKMRESLQIRDELVVGHVGRFNPPKNHPFLLSVFAELVKHESNAVLLLVGGGDGMEDARRRAEELGIEDKVRFLGVRSDVAELMQAMDVFVFPSLYEGLPVTLVEAQAAGLPCVISDRVPDACMLTELVKKVSLGEGAERWAAHVLEARAVARRNRYDEIAASGFDIASNAAWLQRHYIDQWKANE